MEKNSIPLTVDVDFTVSAVGNINGGDITLTLGATAGDILTIYRTQGFDRQTEYQASGDFLAETVNDDMNRIILMLQQNREELSRSLQYQVDDIVGTNPLPLIADRPNKLLGFGPGGDPIAVDSITNGGDFTSVSSILLLKALTGSNGQLVIVTGYFIAADGGGGNYVFNSSSSATDNGGTIIQPNAGSGRWILSDTGIVSVKQFGAKGDGSTDDTLAIQAAIDLAEGQDGRLTVYLPTHNVSSFYKISSELLITKAIRFRGESSSVNIIGYGLLASEFIINIDGTVVPNLEEVALQNITLRSNNSLPGGLKINNASNSLFEDIITRNLGTGITLTGNRNFSNSFERILTTAEIVGSDILYDAYTGGGQHTFTECSFSGGTGFNVSLNSSINNLVLNGCNFETSTDAFLAMGDIFGLSFTGCRFEKNGTSNSLRLDPGVGKVIRGISITGNFFETDAETIAILIGGSGGTVQGFSITGNYAQDYSSTFVHLNGAGEGGVIAGNYIHNIPNVVNVLRPGVAVYNNENSSGSVGAVFTPPLTIPTLPTDAVDITTNNTLTNAIKVLLKDAGLSL